MDKINQLFEHLNIFHAYIAAPFPSDIENFCNNHHEKISGISFIAPNEINNSAFKNSGKKIMIISSDTGATHSAALSLKNEISDIRTFEIKNYEILPWTDLAIDHPTELVENISTYFSELPCKDTNPSTPTMHGKINDIHYTVQGSGPPLILLPFTLSAAQWEPVIPELAKNFTVIVASGPSLGFIPTLEGRAFLPTFQAMFSTLVSFMKVPNRAKVLELGCGTGALCRQALRLEKDLAVTGVDINMYLLNGAAQLAEKEGIHVNKYFGEDDFTEDLFSKPNQLNLSFSDATNIPFPDNFFDTLYSVTVLEECDAHKALNEIYRVVRPGGAVGIIVRAIDMPQWLNINVKEELWRKIIVPPQLVSPSGVADKSLYDKMTTANFKNLIMFPYMFSACKGADPSIYDWYLRRIYQTLDEEEQKELGAAIDNVTDDSALIYSQPVHCCVGWK